LPGGCFEEGKKKEAACSTSDMIWGGDISSCERRFRENPLFQEERKGRGLPCDVGRRQLSIQIKGS